MSSVAVIDYGMGNLHSVAKALEHTGRVDEIRVTHDAEQIRSADRVVLPGVGAIRDCMAEIRRFGLDEVIAELAIASAERAFLATLEGGCQVPIAAYAVLDGEKLHLRGFLTG